MAAPGGPGSWQFVHSLLSSSVEVGASSFAFALPAMRCDGAALPAPLREARRSLAFYRDDRRFAAEIVD